MFNRKKRLIHPKAIKLDEVNFNYDGVDYYGVYDKNLKKNRHKDAFPFFFIIELNFFKERFPTEDEHNEVSKYFKIIHEKINAIYDDKINALFVAKIYSVKGYEFIWMMNNDSDIMKIMEKEMKNKKDNISIDYFIEYDKEWKQIDYLFE